MYRREPAVAGIFYEIDKNKLLKQLSYLFERHKFGPKGFEKNKKLVAGIVPHAGYVYSGAVAAWFFSKITKGNYIIIGPNHYGLGYVYSIFPKGYWFTPLGKISVDENALEKFESLSFIREDVSAFVKEHSIEVQIPFLQYRFGNEFKILAIDVINDYPNNFFLETAEKIAKIVYELVEDGWKLVVTSDFSHYVPQETAEKIDKILIDDIMNLDPKRLFLDVIKFNATMCGFVPVAIAMFLALKMDLKPIFYTYKTSGDVTGDYSSVVGYASIGFEEK